MIIMNSKKSVKKTFMNLFITTVLFLSVTGVSINSCTAHILVIGDPGGDLSENYNQAVEISETLKSKGYNVLELYRDKATSENILKGMYGSDAIIYTGHGMCLKKT